MALLRLSYLTFPVFALLIAGTLPGCGSAEYERRLKLGLEEIRQRSAFGQLYGQPVALPGTPLMIRVPRAFTLSFQEGSAFDDKPIDNRRVTIPGVALPGLAVTYEGRVVDSAGGKYPYYMHLFAIERAKAGKLISSKSETPSALDTTGELYQQIQKAFDRTHGSWAEVACQTPYGNQLAWQRLRTEGEQEVHYLRENGSEVYIKRPCVLDVFARIEGRYLVLVVWRAPAAIEDAARIGEVAPLVAGTLLEGQKG